VGESRARDSLRASDPRATRRDRNHPPTPTSLETALDVEVILAVRVPLTTVPLVTIPESIDPPVRVAPVSDTDVTVAVETAALTIRPAVMRPDTTPDALTVALVMVTEVRLARDITADVAAPPDAVEPWPSTTVVWDTEQLFILAFSNTALVSDPD